MENSCLSLPNRHVKPREYGITILIDNGIPLNFFKDTIISAKEYIDFVKFGWGTSLVTSCLEEKIECLRDNDVEFFFGGTLFEKYLSQGKVEEYYRYCKEHDCHFVEISNGTLNISNPEKARYIRDFSKDFTVFSEVGNKDPIAANAQNSFQWLENILEDFEAGATKVITEARESGTSGLFKENGTIRSEIFNDIRSSGIPLDKLIFEAPNKKIQTFFIKSIGHQVNLGNIPFADAIALETLRLGLRSDTFNAFPGEGLESFGVYKESVSSSDSL